MVRREAPEVVIVLERAPRRVSWERRDGFPPKDTIVEICVRSTEKPQVLEVSNDAAMQHEPGRLCRTCRLPVPWRICTILRVTLLASIHFLDARTRLRVPEAFSSSAIFVDCHRRWSVQHVCRVVVLSSQPPSPTGKTPHVATLGRHPAKPDFRSRSKESADPRPDPASAPAGL